MMKLRNRILWMLMITLFVTVFAGCQSASQPGVTPTAPTTVPTTTAEPTTAATTVPDTTAEQTTAPATTVAPETDPPAAYVYPVLPGTDAWNAMSTTERCDACQIPEDILKSLSTRDLLIAVLDYPLMVDMHSYSNMEQGFLSVKNQFNGLQELVSRPDAKEIAEAFSLKGTRWEENSLIEMSLRAIIKYGLTTYAEGPYIYPVTTGTEAELLEACQVPESLLVMLSDDDLILTVVNHPLINKVLAEGFDQAAYDAFCERINCLGELDLRGASMGMKIFAHMGDPTGVEEYALPYYNEVLTALFTFIQN